MTDPLDPEDAARAELYGVLSTLLAAPPSAETLDACRKIAGDPSTPIGAALNGIATEAGRIDATQVEREFNRLFIGLGRGELLPYASYYLTGHLNDRPLADLRREMKRRGIARAETVFEPEDSAASLLEMMRGLITGLYGAAADIDGQGAFFAAHLEPWIERFFAELEASENAEFYGPVGALGSAFMRIETRAYDLA